MEGASRVGTDHQLVPKNSYYTCIYMYLGASIHTNRLLSYCPQLRKCLLPDGRDDIVDSNDGVVVVVVK